MAVRVNAGSVGQVTGTFLDAAGAGIPASAISSVRLTVTNIDTEDLTASPHDGIINGRDSEEVFAVSPAAISIDDAGAFVLPLSGADNPIVVPRRQVEQHRVVLAVTFTDGTMEWTDRVEVLAIPEAA